MDEPRVMVRNRDLVVVGRVLPIGLVGVDERGGAIEGRRQPEVMASTSPLAPAVNGPVTRPKTSPVASRVNEPTPGKVTAILDHAASSRAMPPEVRPDGSTSGGVNDIRSPGFRDCSAVSAWSR